MNIKFTIVIPVYNRGKSIISSLKSVIDQSYSNFECIVVDDGSEDSELLKKTIENLNDSRFMYIRRENGGGGAARNTGIMAAKGSFIVFLDSDDIFLPKKLNIVAQTIHRLKEEGKNLNNTIFYTYTYVDRGVDKLWIRPDRPIKEGEDVAEYLFVHNQFIQTSTIVLSTRFARTCLFDPHLRKGQDLDFCIRLRKNGGKFFTIEEPLSIWMDQVEEGRTSRFPGYEAPLDWLENNKSILSKRAYFGYRANILSYYYAGYKPFRILKYLFDGLIFGKVPIKVILRQFLRCFLPRSTYRRLVNWFISVNGRLKK